MSRPATCINNLCIKVESSAIFLMSCLLGNFHETFMGPLLKSSEPA